MAPRLRLPENFRVRSFGSSRNVNGIGKYLPPPPIGCVPPNVVQGGDSHVSETRLDDSASRPTPRPPGCPQSEQSVGSEEREMQDGGDGDQVVPDSLKKRKGGGSGKKGAAGKKRAKPDPTRMWQESWSVKYTWGEGEYVGGALVGVTCTICTAVEGRKKSIVPKNDNLAKHQGKRTCTEEGLPLPHLKVGDVYTTVKCQHLQNVKSWAARKPATVADQVISGLSAEYKRKGVQFSTLFQILCHGRPLIEYERSEVLLQHLRVKNMPKKHWSESTGWEISEHIHKSVLSKLKSAVMSARIISISTDEVTAIDNTSWIGVHVYCMQSWERVPHLLHLSHITEAGTADHLTSVIIGALVEEGGLTHADIAEKLVCFGSDGVSTFQGNKTGVATQIKEKWAPFSISVHCTSHRVNLAVETLSKFPMICRLESMLASMHSYFVRCNKRHAELQRLASLMETKGNKILRNNTTRWISMRSPAKRVFEEYKTLIMKMGLDMTPRSGHKVVAGASDNFDFLVDLEVLLSLSLLMPLLSTVHCLIKFSQSRDAFICDFLQTVKMCQEELASKYIDPVTSYGKTEFREYHDLLALQHGQIPMAWKPLGDSGISHLYFVLGSTSVFARVHDKSSGECLFVTQEELNRCADNVERQFTEIAQSLVNELDRRFPRQDVLDALGIIYPQYWQQKGADESFQQHLSVLKEFYGQSRILTNGGNSMVVPEMLSGSNLDTQQALFKVSMRANCEAACAPPYHVNPLVKLWRTLTSSRHLCKLIPEYIKLAEIGSVLVLGSVEDERCFSSVKFLKSCQRNRLDRHLPLVVRMFGQQYFTLENFPYKEAIDSWRSAVKVGRQGDF